MGGSGPLCTQLEHKAGYYVRFRWSDTGAGFRIETTPGREGPEGGFSEAPWASQRERVRDWLGFLKEELTTPGYWDNLKTATQFIKETVVHGDEEVPFSPAEGSVLLGRLDEIEQRLLSVEGLTEAQTKTVGEGFADMRTNLRKISRRAWVTLAAGSVWKIGSAVGLSVTEVHQFFQDLSEVFKGLLPPG